MGEVATSPDGYGWRSRNFPDNADILGDGPGRFALLRFRWSRRLSCVMDFLLLHRRSARRWSRMRALGSSKRWLPRLVRAEARAE